MESGYLDGHNLGHMVRRIMLVHDVSKSQQCAPEKATSILSKSFGAEQIEVSHGGSCRMANCVQLDCKVTSVLTAYIVITATA